MGLVAASIIIVIAGAVALGLYFRAERRKLAEEARNAREQSAALLADAEKQVEALKREALLEAKDEAYRLKAEIENENKERRAELQRLERRLAQKEETLDRRSDAADRRERALQQQEAQVEQAQREAAQLLDKSKAELHRIAALTADQARAMVLQAAEDSCRRDVAKLVRDIEEEAKREAERRARYHVTQAIQRCAVDQTSETTVSVVPLPGDEMKGRIIGREGRNIRAFETQTGVDLIIDDTPEAVVISAFDPVRREIARLALTDLIEDGRIHPGRIEETIRKAQNEVEQSILDAGERAVIETGQTGIAPELVRMLGQLKYRTSYGQNVLKHSIEVSHLAGLLAAEVGADIQLAKRAGLLHDIGKAVDHEVEGAHAAIGADILAQHREKPQVIAAVRAHHGEPEPETIEAVLVTCADSISASRPGARRETLETYVKRVRRLEEIAQEFKGVEKTFAVQAGREVRLIVRPEQVDDLAMSQLARDLARRIEEEMEFPGQIKVTVIRETRAVEYAR
ncbi:MAG: ribonuclease Y [Chthonomonadales bacterium]|nr:ribonuclease Y [Chthonomonadales bacterium]